MAEMKKLFRPEFLNRIDEIIVFKSPHRRRRSPQIVELMVADLRERMIAPEHVHQPDDAAATKLIAKEGTDTDVRRPSAAPRHPALAGGSAFRADPGGQAGQSGSIVDVDVDESGENLGVHRRGRASFPAPRKRDSIARDAELLLTNYDLGHAGVPSAAGGGTASGGAGRLAHESPKRVRAACASACWANVDAASACANPSGGHLTIELPPISAVNPYSWTDNALPSPIGVLLALGGSRFAEQGLLCRVSNSALPDRYADGATINSFC